MTYDIRFKSSSNIIISAPTGGGKTTWVKNLLTLKDQLFTEPPKHIFLFYRKMQDMYLELEKEGYINKMVDVTDNMPNLDEIYLLVHPYKDQGGSLILFDDVMVDINPVFEQLFCNLGHHENCSIIFTTQNLFYRDKNQTFRTMSLNTHYMVLLQNARDRNQISILAKQFSPSNNKFIVQAYQEATKKPYGYLIVDFRPDTPSILRVRSNIFPHEFPCVVYAEK